MWSGILNAAVKLESNTIVLGRPEGAVAEQAREIGLAWEQLPDPRRSSISKFCPGGQREFFLLDHMPEFTFQRGPA